MLHDFIARYKRMNGYSVMFPQGWDCHGLPTEVKVEEIHGITKNDVPREEFREMCRELTRRNIEKMRLTLRILGFSVDWSNEYITMLPEYYRKTQASFLAIAPEGLHLPERVPGQLLYPVRDGHRLCRSCLRATHHTPLLF